MRGYAVVNNRLIKAKKIEAVLQDYLKKKIDGLSILDIGTGVGEIALHFSDRNAVFAVDTEDQLSYISKASNITFVITDSEHLPFADNSFDVIISNHVVEHMQSAKYHLNEVKRCLKSQGVCYFSTPNRIFPKEVHTKTWFLHWLPQKVFFRVLRLLGCFTEPISLLTYWRQKRLFRAVDLQFRDYTQEIINNPEKYHLDERIPFNIPSWAQILSKTTIFVLSR